FEVRDLRASSSTRRLGAGAPAVQAPAYLMSTPPKYPRSAVMARASGNVLALVCIDSRGQPQAQKVIRSSGRSDLDRAATESIREWQFRPASCGGKRYDSWVAVPITFWVGSSGRTPPPPDPMFSRTECARDIALDAEGYTAVTDSCDTDVVCTPESVPKPSSCLIGSRPPGASSR
ncbi:MAG: energy transducer TonB, partial [Lysobacterales bacterium]